MSFEVLACAQADVNGALVCISYGKFVLAAVIKRQEKPVM
jgi:hypothetical protein